MPHRYFAQQVRGADAFLAPADSRHLCVVLRGRPGEEVTVCDGAGTDYVCRLAQADPACCRLEILSSAPSVSEPSVRVKLYVGYPKSDKLEWIIQKAVELGAAEVVPFFSAFCVAAPKKEEQKNQRYNRIAFEAAKQAGRGVIPPVAMPLTYAQMLQSAAQADAALFCYEAAGAGSPPLHSRLENGVRSVSIITGSEGGFSPEEAAQASAAGLTPVGLGPRILRCETAPLAALAVVMALTGNLQ